ncbi:hypothetical protein CYMTET_34851 [Cymbomonas tetramitiformis]|uniref:Uncharacterized protein n=1 Tax=Cymbomonas tetramitiformis TaxID=36881 RepID=A0AAE0KPT1_9CHLO|nr:hypothetical protein CYMTET_34851 [Cymbomonas tetramitiformis]
MTKSAKMFGGQDVPFVSLGGQDVPFVSLGGPDVLLVSLGRAFVELGGRTCLFLWSFGAWGQDVLFVSLGQDVPS